MSLTATYGHGVSLFKFPKDPALSPKWIKNVQKTRATGVIPSEDSVLCSQHFESSCFEVDSELVAQMGIQKCRLKPTYSDRPVIQLPSAQSEPDPSRLSRKRASAGSSSLADTITKKLRTAYENRNVERVSNKML